MGKRAEWPAGSGHVRVCRALLAKGADEGAGNAFGQDAVDSAIAAKQHSHPPP